MKKIIVALMCITNFHFTDAQTTPLHLYTDNNNTWFMYLGNHKISEKWGVHLEAQLRRNDYVAKPQQLLLRTGINYYFNNQVYVTAGYCFVETYPYGEFPAKAAFPENRLWEQLQIKTQLKRVEWVSRFRLEQRFSNLPVINTTQSIYEPGDAVYTNRFRLLNRFSIPFKGETIVDKSLYATVYDEFFINFGKNVAANFLDQNRAYAAIGYKIPSVGKLEIGYMYQTIFKGDGVKIENNHTLQIGLSSTIDFYKSQTK